MPALDYSIRMHPSQQQTHSLNRRGEHVAKPDALSATTHRHADTLMRPHALIQSPLPNIQSCAFRKPPSRSSIPSAGMSTLPSQLTRTPMHTKRRFLCAMACVGSIPAFDYSIRKHKSPQHVILSMDGVMSTWPSQMRRMPLHTETPASLRDGMS